MMTRAAAKSIEMAAILSLLDPELIIENAYKKMVYDYERQVTIDFSNK